MLEGDGEEAVKIVEVIEVTGPAETVVCIIGAWRPANRVVCMSTYRNNELVNEEMFGFGPTLPMAQLVGDLEEKLRNDACAMGGRFEIVEIPESCGLEEFEAVVAARRAAATRQACEPKHAIPGTSNTGVAARQPAREC